MKPSEDFFRDLCENAHDLIQSVDAEGRFLYVNRAWLETLGYSREELPELRVLDVIHPESREHCRLLMEALHEGKESIRFETEYLARDGRRIAVEGTATCRFEGGRPVSTRALLRDVTDRERARQDRDRLFQLALDMMCVAGFDGYFKQINPAFVRVLQYPREELMRRRFIEFVHAEDREKTESVMGRLAAGEPVVDFQNRYVLPSGAVRWLAWHATPVPGQELIYATARDITEEKRVRQLLEQQTAELARSNSELEQFASVASHDLRAPLRGMRNLVDWIEQELPQDVPESVQANVGRLRSQIERMRRFTADLLAYSRVGRTEERLEDLDTNELVGELARLLEPSSDIEIVVLDTLPRLEAPRAPLEQVFRNLIGNAIEHHDQDKGRVEIAVRDAGEAWEFSVTDDGPGIPKGAEEEIFQMFHRVGRGGHGGTGIGLALVRKIVEAHGGKIAVEPANDRGSVFRFTWPARARKRD